MGASTSPNWERSGVPRVTTLKSEKSQKSSIGSGKRSLSRGLKSVRSAGKLLREQSKIANFTQESQAYMERIEQVYRHYTVND